MARIASLLDVIGKLQSNKINVAQERCVVVRNRNARCLRCAQECASGCISFDDEAQEVVIDLQKCIGCGTCATVCPTCALEAVNPSDSQLLKELVGAMDRSDGEVVIACGALLEQASGLYDSEKVVSVPCLGRMEESLLLALAAMGARSVALVCPMRGECEYTRGVDAAETVLETTHNLLDAWGLPIDLSLREKLPSSVRAQGSAAYDADRRAFFSDVASNARRGAGAVADAALEDALGVDQGEAMPRFEKVGDDGTLSHFLPNRRNRTLAALRQLGSPDDVMVSTRLWGHVVIDAQACSSCQMCATFCPTAALAKFQAEDGTFGVQHAPSLCVKCRCCEEVCLTGSLRISEEVFAVDLLEGVVEHYPMKPRLVEASSPHQTQRIMRKLLNCDQVYER